MNYFECMRTIRELERLKHPLFFSIAKNDGCIRLMIESIDGSFTPIHAPFNNLDSATVKTLSAEGIPLSIRQQTALNCLLKALLIPRELAYNIVAATQFYNPIQLDLSALPITDAQQRPLMGQFASIQLANQPQRTFYLADLMDDRNFALGIEIDTSKKRVLRSAIVDRRRMMIDHRIDNERG